MGSSVLEIRFIGANNVVLPSFRIPAGIYVIVNGCDHLKTAVKALIWDCTVIWNETVKMTSVPSTLSIELRAAFESGVMVGKGELIGKVELSPEELLARDELSFPVVRDVKFEPVVTLKASYRTVPTDAKKDHVLLDSIGESECALRQDVETVTADTCVDRSPLDCIGESESQRTIAEDTDDGHAQFAAFMAVTRGFLHLERALDYFKSAVRKCPPGHDARAAALTNLAWARLAGYVYQKPKNSENIIRLFREALELRPLGTSDHALSTFHLAYALNQLHKSEDDIRESATLYCSLLLLCPEGTDLRSIVVDGDGLEDVIHKINNFPISESDLHLRRMVVALSRAGHQRRPRPLEMLARTLCKCGTIDAIEESVKLRREVVSMYPVEHPRLYIALNHLITSLHLRFGLLHDSRDVDEIRELCKESLNKYPAWYPGYHKKEHLSVLLNNLGVVVVNRFLREYNIEDMSDAIPLFRFAQGLCPDSEKRLHALVLGLLIRHNDEDLEEAIYICSQSGLLNGPDTPKRRANVSNLRSAFFSTLTQVRRNGRVECVRLGKSGDEYMTFAEWFQRACGH